MRLIILIILIWLYLELVDMVALGTFERSCLRKMSHLLWEMFVGQMEDHCLLADIFLAHQTRLHAGHSPLAAPPSQVSSTPATMRPGTAPVSTMWDHVSGVGIMVSTSSHHIVIVFEYIAVSHSVVNGQVVTDLRLVGTVIKGTFERSNLERIFVYQLRKNILISIPEVNLGLFEV